MAKGSGRVKLGMRIAVERLQNVGVTYVTQDSKWNLIWDTYRQHFPELRHLDHRQGFAKLWKLYKPSPNPPRAKIPVAPRAPMTERVAANVASVAFLRSGAWRRVRMVALLRYGARCQACGATPSDGVRLNVDHVKPRLHYPELALDVNNLQVLCEECNHGKGNWNEKDWRAE